MASVEDEKVCLSCKTQSFLPLDFTYQTLSSSHIYNTKILTFLYFGIWSFWCLLLNFSDFLVCFTPSKHVLKNMVSVISSRAEEFSTFGHMRNVLGCEVRGAWRLWNLERAGGAEALGWGTCHPIHQWLCGRCFSGSLDQYRAKETRPLPVVGRRKAINK